MERCCLTVGILLAANRMGPQLQKRKDVSLNFNRMHDFDPGKDDVCDKLCAGLTTI